MFPSLPSPEYLRKKAPEFEVLNPNLLLDKSYIPKNIHLWRIANKIDQEISIPGILSTDALNFTESISIDKNGNILGILEESI